MKNIIEHGAEILADIDSLLDSQTQDKSTERLSHLRVAVESCVEAAELTGSKYILTEIQRDLNTVDSALIQIARDA